MVSKVLTINRLAWAFPPMTRKEDPPVAAQGTSSKGSPNIAEWLPLLGSIVRALSDMAEDDRPPNRPATPPGSGENQSATTEP